MLLNIPKILSPDRKNFSVAVWPRHVATSTILYHTIPIVWQR